MSQTRNVAQGDQMSLIESRQFGRNIKTHFVPIAAVEIEKDRFVSHDGAPPFFA